MFLPVGADPCVCPNSGTCKLPLQRVDIWACPNEQVLGMPLQRKIINYSYFIWEMLNNPAPFRTIEFKNYQH
jgi:hypothetical protein